MGVRGNAALADHPGRVEPVLGTIVGLLEILAVVLVVDRILLWAEARGWIQYRRKTPGAGGGPDGPSS